MTKYNRSSSVQGAWVKKETLREGQRAKIVGETSPEEGTYGKQDVTKIRFEGDQETKNMALNKTTINALIDAFGDDSKNWINHYLTVHAETTRSAGKKSITVYLIPEGFEWKDDEEGYIHITKIGAPIESPPDKPAEKVELEDAINPDEIPF